MKKSIFLQFLVIAVSTLLFSQITACSSGDDDSPSQPEPPEMEDPVADPTNSNTTIVATSPVLADGMTTSNVTVTIADTDGNKFSSSAGTVALSATGSAVVSTVTDNANGTYSATVTNTTPETVTISGTLGGTAITATADIIFDPVPEEDSLVIAINAGGEEVTIGDITFVKDTLFTTPSQPFANNQITDILGTDADTLYFSERIRGGGMGTIGYNIPVENANYEVKMHFAEIFWGLEDQGGGAGGEGSRIFDVIVEDSLILDDYDIFVDAGGAATAIIKMHETMVADDTLNVVLSSSVDQPKISALEIIKKGDN
jgi:hypothetical protein